MQIKELEDLSPKGQMFASTVLVTIRSVRQANQACTAGELSRVMKVPKQNVLRGLDALRERHLVDWTDLAGSIHLTTRGRLIAGKLAKEPAA